MPSVSVALAMACASLLVAVALLRMAGSDVPEGARETMTVRGALVAGLDSGVSVSVAEVEPSGIVTLDGSDVKSTPLTAVPETLMGTTSAPDVVRCLG